MAVSKLWQVRKTLEQVIDYANNPNKTNARLFSDEDYRSLKDVLRYAKDESKTDYEYFCDGINCNTADARNQFIAVKEQFRKLDGVQAYHGVLSFKENEVTPELAQKIGMEFAQRVWGEKFQVVVTTHLNTKHLHCHFVVNSVSFVDGKKLDNEEKAWFHFHHIADELCEKYGLSVIKEPEISKQNKYMQEQDKKISTTRYNIAREAMDKALMNSTSLRQLGAYLQQIGYSYNFNPDRKYWTITPKGYSKPIRLKNLGEQYTNEKIMDRLAENREKPVPKKVTRTPAYMTVPKRKPTVKGYPHRSKVYRLYLFYCYQLGVLPKNKNRDNTKLHYLLKEDLYKVDRITAEVRFMGKHNIETDEQLSRYRKNAVHEMFVLDERREQLYKEQRLKKPKRSLEEIKAEMTETTEKIRELRKEVKLCDNIARRSQIMFNNLQSIEKEELDFKRKERLK